MNLSKQNRTGWKFPRIFMMGALIFVFLGCASDVHKMTSTSSNAASFNKDDLEKEQKDRSKRTPTITPGAGQPSVSSSFDNDEYNRFVELTPNQARVTYGNTVEGYFGKDVVFTLAPRGVEHPFRADLVTAVDQLGVDLSNTPVRVLEMTWVVDQFRLITIWFIHIEPSGRYPNQSRFSFDDFTYAQHIVWNRFWNFDVECPEGTMTEAQFLECQRGYRTNYYNGIQLRFEVD